MIINRIIKLKGGRPDFLTAGRILPAACGRLYSDFFQICYAFMRPIRYNDEMRFAHPRLGAV